MKFGISSLAVLPVRRMASDASEMVTQVLFGETFEILSEKKKWLRIKCRWDNYEGWVDSKQVSSLSEAELLKAEDKPSFSLELTQAAMSNNHYVPILLGSALPAYDGMNFELAGQAYTFSGQVIKPSETKISSDLLIKIARKYLYAPYLWGGRSPFGIDCSGFVQIVFRMLGYALDRDSSQQVRQGNSVDFVQEVKVGDLAFFENENGKIVHVGIIMPDGEIIHASGQVKIDLLDHYGIYNPDTKSYTHKLRIIKRIIPELESPAFSLIDQHPTKGIRSLTR